jgi:hypothetical protein
MTNTANTRVFNATLPGAQMKLVGADATIVTRRLVDEVLLPPSACRPRRAVSGRWRTHLEHRTPERTYGLLRSRSSVSNRARSPRSSRLRTNRDMAEQRQRIEPFPVPPDKTLSFVAEMDMGVPGVGRLRVPDHPEL